MAASPLAEIDWDNLTDGSQSLVTALNLLEKMFAERVTLPTLVNTHLIATNYVDRFPFLDNSPDYGLAGWPAVWGPRVFSLGGILRGYLSDTKVTALQAGGLYSQFAATVDQATLFSDFSITQYPSMEVINSVEIKKWYDILSSLKWLHSSYEAGGNTITNGGYYDSTYREGLLDESNTGGGAFGNYRRLYEDSVDLPIAQFDTDFSQMWTGPSAKQLSDEAFAPYYEFDYIGGPTSKRVIISKGYQRFDISTFEATGHGGLPQDHRSFGSMRITPTGGVGFTDYTDAFPYQDVVFAEFPKPLVVSIGSGIYEYEIPFAEPATLPTTSGSFKATFVNSGGCSTFDLWDAEGGFEFYTP